MPDRETLFITGFPGFIANRLLERLARKDCDFILLVQPALHGRVQPKRSHEFQSLQERNRPTFELLKETSASRTSR